MGLDVAGVPHKKGGAAAALSFLAEQASEKRNRRPEAA
jgi:hypothetical protein